MKKYKKEKKNFFVVCVTLFLCSNIVNVTYAKNNTTTWNCIWFGTYPQTEIKNYKEDGEIKYSAVDFKEQVWEDFCNHDFESTRYYANANHNGESKGMVNSYR